MKYALGNMLNGAGSLNPDGLALDLQFASDKTLTARKGPTPVFTRASTATFVGSNGLIQSAAINAARFDHDPVTLASRGLLIEESRTNLNIRSEEIGNAAYASQALLPVSSNVGVSPDGSTSADKIIENTSNSVHRLFTTQFATTSGVTYTASVFAKFDGRRYFYLNAGVPFNAGTTFDLQNGVVSGAGAGTNSITNFGNGWYRCSVTGTATSSSPAVVVSLHINNTVSTAFDDAYTGNGSSGLLLWGIQIEAGSFPTSYIPTTTASVVRSADVCSITGSSFTGFYNHSEGTLLVSAFTPASGDRTIVASDDNTANEMIRLRTEGTNPLFKVTDGGSELVAIDSGGVVANSVFKLSGAYKLNDFASSVNGGSSVTDVTGTIPTVDRMRIGAGQSGNTMCGCVSSLRYYRKRLSNAKIQALTV